MKKECQINSELLVDYVYGEITDVKKQSEVESHIKTCASCAAEVKKLKMVIEASKLNEVKFSSDIWAIHKEGILKKLKKADNPIQYLRERFHAIFDFKVLGVATLILLMTGVGIQYYKVIKVSQNQKAIAEQMELLQNFEIIERLDFYQKVSRQ